MSKTLEFKIFCIEAYKNSRHLTGNKTLELFEKYGVLNYLNSSYDVLHTLSLDFVIEDIDDYINARKI